MSKDSLSVIYRTDSNVYAGDEVKKVHIRVPQSIIIATVSNAIMLFAFSICLLFMIGNVDLVTNTPSGVPLIEVYYLATKSKPAATFFTLMPVIILFVALFNIFASVSRLVWAFSRDKGFPFSKFFSRVSWNENCNELSAKC